MIARVAETKRSTNSSNTLRSTKTRLRAQQSWPALEKTLIGDLLAACSKSASAKLMLGDFPPSSKEIRLISREASSITREPTAVEPVKEILRTSGCVTSASPTAVPAPGRTWSAPAGNPASIAICAKRNAESGEGAAGLSTTEFPVASAGATFQQVMGNGKFHGTIAATTPIGW